VQRIFKCDKIRDTILTVDKVLNSLTYGSPFCVAAYMSYKLLKNARFLLGHRVEAHDDQGPDTQDFTVSQSGHLPESHR